VHIAIQNSDPPDATFGVHREPGATGFNGGARRTNRASDHLRVRTKPIRRASAGVSFASDPSPQISRVMGQQNLLFGRCVRLAQRFACGQRRLLEAPGRK
jgi:hypothetical protein